MIDARMYSRQFLTEFIMLYKSLPCLWKKKSKDYSNRDLKAACYKKMVEKLSEIHPNATREIVIRKINSIRVSRRKEWIKVQNSIVAGTEVYKPTLWYYDLLSFTEECEEGDDVKMSDDIMSLNTITSEEVKTEAMEEVDRLRCEVRSCEESMSETSSQYIIEYEDADLPVTSHVSTTLREQPRSSKRKLTRSSYEDSRAEERQDDRFDIFGKSVALKMRGLPTQQRLIAEKIINDTLFNAEMGFLTLSDVMELPRNSNKEV